VSLDLTVNGSTGGIIKIFKRQKSILLFLTISTIVPYFLVLMYLSSITTGVHGTLTLSWNSAIIPELNMTQGYDSVDGHLNGTISIDHANGWLYCNGYIQFIGPYQVDNADVDYTAHPARSSPHDLPDPAEIILSGEKGNLRTGYPISVFSLFVVPFGIITCLIWLIIKKFGLKTHPLAWWAIFVTYLVTQIVALLYEPYMATTLILIGFAIVIFILLRASKKKFLYYLNYINSGLTTKYLLERLPLFYAFTGFLFFLFDFFLLGTQYFEWILISMYLAVIPIVWGLGAISELRKRIPNY
jgi:hypothetical protein